MKRWTGLDVTQWDGARLEVELSDSVQQDTTRRSVFVFVREDVSKLEVFELRHLCGVAQMRHRLQVPPGRSWQVSTERRHAMHEPDALWVRQDRRWIAAEYDAGGYSRDRLVAKATAFRTMYGFGAQVWGCSSERRVSTVNEIVEPFGGKAFHAPWR